MAKKNKEEVKGERSFTEWHEEVKNMFEADKNWRSTSVDRAWWINRSYYSGNQIIKYDPNTGSLVEDSNDPLRFQVNLIYPTVRVIRAVLTRINPVWDVDSYPYGNLDENEVRNLNQFMASLYEKLDLKETTKEMVFYGLICGLGILQYGFDEEKDKGEGELWVESLDPMDVYFGDRSATGLESASRITKSVLRSLSYMKQKEEDGLYKNVKELQSSTRTADSSYKEMLTIAQGLNSSGSSAKGEGTVLLRETWVKKKDGVYVVTWSEGFVHRVEKSRFDKLPFVLYKPDINPGQFYNEGWVKPLVPIQKMINYLQRKIAQYNASMAVGMYVTDQESGISMIENESGKIIRKNRGSQFDSLSPQPLNSTPFSQLNDLYTQFQNISGVQEALMGRPPTGVTAAIALETLVSNSVANFADLIDNLAITMGNLGECLIELAYQNYGVSKTFRVKDSEGNVSVMRVGGKEASLGEGAVRLPERSQVRVKVVEGTAYTRQGRQQVLMSLRGMGDIDRHTLLAELGLDADGIENKVNTELQGQSNSANAKEEKTPASPEGSMSAEGEMAPEQADIQTQVEEFIAELERQGVALGEEFIQQPELLLGVIEGSIDAQVIEGQLRAIV